MSAQPTKPVATSSVPKVDCRNDHQMVKAGIRPPLLVQNPEWHKKTEEERKLLKKVSKIKGLRPSAPPKTVRTLPHRITVHLKNLKKNPEMKTTISDVIYEDQIYDYMMSFFGTMKDEVKVIYYNGKNITEKLVL